MIPEAVAECEFHKRRAAAAEAHLAARDAEVAEIGIALTGVEIVPSTLLVSRVQRMIQRSGDGWAKAAELELALEVAEAALATLRGKVLSEVRRGVENYCSHPPTDSGTCDCDRMVADIAVALGLPDTEAK
jgi:hypothetical protein